MRKWDVLVFGDINIDLLIPDVERLPLPGREEVIEDMRTCVGGGAALTALGLAKLGVNTASLGLVGGDVYGRFILDELGKWGVNCERLGVSGDSQTGISLCFTNKGDRSFLTCRGTNAAIDPVSISDVDIAQTRHVHMTCYAGSGGHHKYLAALKRIRGLGGVSVSMDVGWDDTGEWYEGIFELLPYVSVLFMNETEALHYTRKGTVEEAAEVLRKCPLTVLKLGSRGSAAISGEGLLEAGAYAACAVDTTGAGDSFNAGFIYGYLKGAGLLDCLRYGNACGAMSVQALGGNTGFPDEAGLLDFMGQEGRG